jgi:hypothetical protein
MTTNELLTSNSLLGTNAHSLDDRSSVASGDGGVSGCGGASQAWSTTATTDMINNSGADSDFECHSPNKYTPYSTYSSSSYCSNAMMIDHNLVQQNLAASSNNSNLSSSIVNQLVFFSFTDC